MDARELIASDRFRYFGTDRPTVRRRYAERVQLGYLKALRRAQCASGGVKGFLRRLWLNHLAVKTHYQIPWTCPIGPGLYIGHLGRVIVNPGVTIGANCNVATGVTLGAVVSGARRGAPAIGDEVWIGTNAVVVGGVRIGSDVVVAPGAFVNFDVPDHSVVVGNPGVVHRRGDAAADYIQNKVPARPERSIDGRPAARACPDGRALE